MPPRYPWDKGSFPEALFQDKHMAYEVQSDALRGNASKLSNKKLTHSVRITHLSHCTHDEQAREIEECRDYLCFKAYRRDPRENTHVYNIEDGTTKQLFDHHSVLPGYLSWWGISTIERYKNDDRRGRDIVKQLAQGDKATNETIYVPPYLQYTIHDAEARACSVYGGNSFSCPIRNLIESYKQSRNSWNNKIYFKKAGTLRYTHEICYVILVCMKQDLRNEDISSMPGAGQPDINMGTEVRYFNLGDESIAPDGELLTMELIPEFISEYPIRAIYTGSRKDRLGRFYSWDTLNFAFYFPHRQGELLVKSDDITHTATKHDRKSCHLRPHLGDCPDQDIVSIDRMA